MEHMQWMGLQLKPDSLAPQQRMIVLYAQRDSPSEFIRYILQVSCKGQPSDPSSAMGRAVQR